MLSRRSRSQTTVGGQEEQQQKEGTVVGPLLHPILALDTGNESTAGSLSIVQCREGQGASLNEK